MMSKTLHPAFPSVAFLIGCILVSVAAFNCLGNQRNVRPQKSAESAQPILDLTIFCEMNCPEKEVLMRLYKNGQADLVTYDAKYNQIIRRFSLLPKEVRNLIKLAQSRGFQESKDRYEKLTTKRIHLIFGRFNMSKGSK